MELKKAEVKTWPAQAAEMQNPCNRADYLRFIPHYFTDEDNTAYMEALKLSLSSPKPDFPDYLLLKLTGFEAAEYGFPLVGGQLQRHKKEPHSWQRSIFSPEHQLALACYIARLNNQVYEFRDRWSRELLKSYPEFADGVWGVWFRASMGQPVPDLASIKRQVVIDRARERMFGEEGKEPKPICLPNPQLNQDLAEFNFTGNKADTISKPEFENEVLPAAKAILDKYLPLVDPANKPLREQTQSLFLPA